MSPLPPDRLNELRDLAKVLAGTRGRDHGSGRSPRVALLGIAILVAGVALAWRVTTPCGLRSCEERYATSAPAMIAVAQAPMPRNDAAEESASVAPVSEPVPEPQPTVHMNEQPATNEIGTLLAAERAAGAFREPQRVPYAAPPAVETVRTKQAPPRPRVAAAATPRRALQQRPSATPQPARPAPVIAVEPPESETPSLSIAPAPVPEVAQQTEVAVAPETEAAAPETEVAPETGRVPNLSGRWLLTNAIDTTTHSAFAGLRIRFRVQLEQHGESITGRGEKYTVDDEPLPRKQRTPIVLEGTVRGRDVLVRFLEHGTDRVSSGGFRWRIAPDGKTLQGTFESTAAGTRGRSHATRDG